MTHKFVYAFSEGNTSMRDLLGGKGANISEMIKLGLPVPDGFVVTTEACSSYYSNNKSFLDEIKTQIIEQLSYLEQKTGKRFGDKYTPLLLSIRSSSRAAMPGMLDAVLNLGLNDEVVQGLADTTQKPRFAYDSYRRFVQMFSEIIMEMPKRYFEEIIDDVKVKEGVIIDQDLSVEAIKIIIEKFKKTYKIKMGHDFPKSPHEQLLKAIGAVFKSWDNPRANSYRRINDIPYNWGTAVTIQEMVYGNMSDDSGTGVMFTRNPSDGVKSIYGEYLLNAQGEDVVSGIRTPYSVSQLENDMPEIYTQLTTIAKRLEVYFKDMQDLEFTIERRKLYILQTRRGKRTAKAAIKIAVDLVSEGLISRNEALLRIDPKNLDTLLHSHFNDIALRHARPICRGLPASPGVACGKLYFFSEDVISAVEKGEKAILARIEMSPEDINGMQASEGIITSRGGMTSHASIVARGMGKCCVSGCGELRIIEDEKYCIINGQPFYEGDWLSLDGSTGNVYGEVIEIERAMIAGDFAQLMKWARQYNSISVRAFADYPQEIRQSLEYGADGIGLMRTEHLYFESDRILLMRRFILSSKEKERIDSLSKLLPMHKADFKAVFSTARGKPMAIRLFDPPLSEFLPYVQEDIGRVGEELNISEDELRSVMSSLHEFNPMMGHRGCRLYITYPELLTMQVRTIVEAAIEVINELHKPVIPEIIVPMVSCLEEIKQIKHMILKTIDAVEQEKNLKARIKIGMMLETPRAALIADEIAKEVDFISLGTNDLTQFTYGMSGDDAGAFLNSYYSDKIFEFDPFSKIDECGVGSLIVMATQMAHSVSPSCKIGVCGQHGGDPASIDFFVRTGVNYVTCSPSRIPIAQLAVAQAEISQKMGIENLGDK